MDFIREKIKEKPVNKKRIAMKVGMAVLCGLVFALTVCAALAFLLPRLQDIAVSEDSEGLGHTEHQNSQSTESGTEEFLFPPDFNLSISDYQTLQNELYQIGSKVNKSIVMVGSSTEWMENAYETSGQGVGTIIGSDNYYLYILTEARYFADTEHIRVTFIDETGADAKILKQDANTGITVLTVENRQLKEKTKNMLAVAELGSSYTVENGAVVIALGTNFSIFTGNITSVENEFTTLDKNYAVYTTDIVGGVHGSGVLVNVRGEVIGMVMQSFGSPQELGTLTVVPMTEIRDMVEQLKNGRDIPYVGLYISTVTEGISEDYDIPKGVYIKDVAADSPAMKAGLQSGDVITHINGEKVETDDDYSEKVSQLIPGTTCEITVNRQNGDGYYVVTCVILVGIL